MSSCFFFFKFELRRGKGDQRSDFSLFSVFFLGQNFLFNLLFYFICHSAYRIILKIAIKGVYTVCHIN